MSHTILTEEARRQALGLRDLSDPSHGPHAMQLVIERVVGALARHWRARLALRRADPVVTIRENYDDLHYPADAVTRDARYSRYLSETTLLRTHTSAMIPPLLRQLAGSGPILDLLLACPGLVYRRDCIDRLHTGAPHQVDLWRIARRPLGDAALAEMVELVVHTLLPGREYRLTETSHPYTVRGRQIDVLVDGSWVEIGECGLALPALLQEAGLAPGHYGGLAMGLGLDRLLMLVKRIPDIRLLRSEDPRVAAQMLDLLPYRAVSAQPAIRRDLSIAVAGESDAEWLGDRVRQALGTLAESIEAIEVLSETPYELLPAAAVERLGMRPGQKNVLLRLVIRDPVRTLTDEEANRIRNDVYEAVHEGVAWQWARSAAAG